MRKFLPILAVMALPLAAQADADGGARQAFMTVLAYGHMEQIA